MSIAKKLCELMGGEIHVNSEAEHGSCFELNILLAKSQLSQQVMPQVDISSLTLLIVDDNATNREALRGQLEHWKAHVIEAQGGAQALEICHARLQDKDRDFFDIAFLDMQMPEMDGAELSKQLQNHPRFKKIKMVMMTSMNHQGDAKYFAGLGFSAYFPKPATTSDLFDALVVVAESGETLLQAQPLVTHHYLKSIKHNNESALSSDRQAHWPDNTRVLLVEDNHVNQLVAEAILEEIGLQADIAENGLEALKSLRQPFPYSVVLMDCQMPKMDGYEITQQIRAGKVGEQNKTLPIIAMTANAMVGDREKCLQAGMSDYLSKPIDSKLLLRKLQQWLNGSSDQQTVAVETSNNPNRTPHMG